MSIIVSKINQSYSVGLYIRLSREDDDKAIESESITNQKSLLLQYANENNLMVYDIYVDDGYSGTSFDRPGFKKLIDDIEHGKINMVITKDMSRLGRDYIETGNLVEKYFPTHGIRYIAVTDNIDTFLDSSNNDIAPFKAIINDFYARDISKKIKSSLKAKMKEGKFVSGRTPFGYSKDPDDKNHLVIHEEQAKVVKRIFEMSLNGMTYFNIAKQLTDEGVKTPASYYSFKWRSNYNLNYNNWHPKTIQDILTNRIYTGDLVQNRRNKVNYKVKKIVRNKPSDFIVVENTHEPIVDKETFYEVQKRIPKNVGRNEKIEYHLLDGLLYCGDCGHRISVSARRKSDNNCYTMCNYYRSYIRNKVCTSHCNNYDKFEKAVLSALRKSCLEFININKIKNKVLDGINDTNSQINRKKEIENITKEINQINENFDTIYIDKLNKTITNEQFERVKSKLESTLVMKQKRYNELTCETIDEVNEQKRDILINKYIDEFLNMENPTRELIINLIDRIEIFDDKWINLKLCFSNKNR